MCLRARALTAHLLGAIVALCSAGAQADLGARAIQDVDVQKLANGILGIMSYTVAPDVTTSSLAIGNAATASPGLSMTQVGGGFTFSKSTPLYMEGNAAYSRYDPVFLASDGSGDRLVLGISDTTPPDADFGRLQAIARRIDAFGPVGGPAAASHSP